MAKKTDVDIITDEKIKNGGILVKFYFDVQNSDKEKLQPLLVDLVNNRLLKERGVIYCYGKINEPIERDGIFLTSAVVTTLFDKIGPLFNIIFNYAPAGIEIMKPEKEFNMRISDLQSILIDMSGISISYSRYILEKVLDPKDVEQIRKQIDNRIEISKKAIESSKGEHAAK